MHRLGRDWLSYVIVLFFGLALFVPFLGQPVLRTGGDEKVYIAQALEMVKRGSWFVQTLADQPDYYKGPLHYIFLRLGFSVFGTQTPWAVLWANLAAVLACGLLLTNMVRRYLRDDSLAAAVGMALLAAGGIYSYVFTSQMEIELLGMYGLTLYLTDRWHRSDRPTLVGILVWMTIGLTGWLKSPVHSVLLGLSVGLVALVEPRLRRRQWSLGGGAAILLGVITGASGYAIPWILDPESFYKTYILRETVAKAANEVSVLETFLPNITFNLLPFMPLAMVGLVFVMLGMGGAHVGQRSSLRTPKLSVEERYLARLTLGMSLPTFVFFALHPYRSTIYTLPCIPAVLLLSAVGLSHAKAYAPRLTLGMAALVPLFALSVPLLALVIAWKFGPHTPWWPQWLTVAAATALVGTLAVVARLVQQRSYAWSAYVLACLPSFMVAGSCLALIGKAELQDLRAFVDSQKKASQPVALGYYNLHRHTWSEWGSLNVLLGEQVVGIHDESSLKAALFRGIPVIVPSSNYMEQIYAVLGGPQNVKVYPWRRWQSHPKDSVARGPLAAWRQGDLSLLKSEAYIVTLR